MISIVKKYPLRFYYIFAFTFSGLFWTIGQLIASKYNYKLYTMDSLEGLFKYGFKDNIHLIAYLLFFIAVYGPILSAILVSYITKGQSGIINVFRQKESTKFNKLFYLVLLLPLLINVTALLIGSSFSGEPIVISGVYPILMIIPFFIYQVFTSGLEEPGWRGFLLPELIKKYGVDKAGWLSGLLWAIWHLPFVLPLYWSLGLIPSVSALAGFIAAIVGQAYIFTWIYQNTKSTFLAVLFHASLNTFSIFIIGTTKDPMVAILPAILSWVVVFVLEKISDKNTFLLKKS